MSDMRSGQRYFFIHVQKTGGTSLLGMLEHQFGRRGIYPDHDDGDPIARVIDVEHLRRRYPERRGEVRVVSGHFPACTSTMLGDPFVTLTLLREPVDRTMSYLRHHRRETPGDRNRTLEEIYDDPFRYETFIHNHMVKVFALDPGELTGGLLTPIEWGGAHLSRAKARLATVDVVGVQEDFDKFCSDLTARFGWDLGRHIHANATRKEDDDHRLRERIAEDNALDIELYRYARSLIDDRSRHPIGTS